MTTAIVNTKLILEEGILFDGALVIRDGRIADFGRTQEVRIPSDAEIIDANGKYTAPGLVDIHNHGAGLTNFHETPAACAEHFLLHGQTTVLPTFYQTIDLNGMLEGGRRIREASKSGAGRIMDGLYMEGPYMNGGGSFASELKWHDDILPEEYMPLVDGLKDLVRIWAIDPDRKGIEAFMAYAKQANPNVIFALGHSHATYEACARLKKYGIRDCTHMGDSGEAEGAVKGLPGAGAKEYAMTNSDMFGELICDENAVHVVPGLMRLYVKTMGVERVVLITDSMNDRSNGAFKNDPSRVPFSADLNYDETGWLAGSHLTLDNAVCNMMAHTGYGLCHAIRMASLTPATLLGLENEIGSVALGKRANLILIDDMVHVDTVLLDGEVMVRGGKRV